MESSQKGFIIYDVFFDIFVNIAFKNEIWIGALFTGSQMINLV